MEQPNGASNGPSFPSSPGAYIANFFSTIPQLSKIIGAVLVVGWLLTLLFPNIVYAFALLPGYTLGSFRIWNLFTYGIIHISLFSMLFNVFLVLVMGRTLEPLWGSREYLRFVLVVDLFSGIVSFFALSLIYMFTGGKTSILFETPWSGFNGVTAAFTIAIKQIIPEQEVPVFGVWNLRAKNLPALLFGISTLFALLMSETENISYPFTVSGLVVGWIYLRFYQPKENGSYGDLSDEFSFASFFPESIRPPINLISTFVLGLVMRCCACVCFSTNRSVSRTASSTLPTVNEPIDPDVERRRARALLALDQRMKKQADETNISIRIDPQVSLTLSPPQTPSSHQQNNSQ